MSLIIDLKKRYNSDYDFFVFDLDNEPMKWYLIPDVQFKIIKSLFNREFAMVAPSYIKNPKNDRNMRVHNVQGFSFMLKCHDVHKMDKIYNFYYSVAKYKHGIPYRDFSKPIDDQKKANEKWKNKAANEIISYDYVIDIDADNNILKAHEVAKKIVKSFQFKNMAFDVRFTGDGFHIISHPDTSFKKEHIEKYKKQAIKLSIKHGMVDTVIYSARQLIKLPYSISFYEDKKYLCKPLSMEEFINFKIEDALLENNRSFYQKWLK